MSEIDRPESPVDWDNVGRYRSASDSFRLGLKEIISTPKYRNTFRGFLQSVGRTKELDFLEALYDYQDSVANFRKFSGVDENSGSTSGGATPPAPGRRKRRSSLGAVSSCRLTAKGIHNKFLSADSEFCLDEVDPAEAENILQRIQGWKFSATVAPSIQELDDMNTLFYSFEQYAFKHIHTDLFPPFLESDYYIEMMVNRVANEDHKVPSAIDESDDDLEDIPDDEDDDNDPSKIANAYEKTTGWSNKEGYVSVLVDVLSAEGLRTGTMGSAPDAYTVVTVDSTSFKTKAVHGRNPDWSGDSSCHFEFPLRITTQNVNVRVFDHNVMRSDKYLGAVDISIASLVKSGLKTETTISETKYFPISKPVDSGSDDHKKERGQLQVAVTLSKDPHVDTGHKQISYETTSAFADAIRQKVSKKKRRFVEDGFDLDLTYITDRVIAMGYPSQQLEGVYRNNMQTMKLFFDKRHPGHYKVYNLCSERQYDPDSFSGDVVRYPFDDHNPCPFTMLDEFCADVHDYLAEHPQNIAAIHCKAGKGRTGLVIACYMLYVKLFPAAVSSLKFYAVRRTFNSKGVTIPSQIRYVYYYDRYLRYQRLIARAHGRLNRLSNTDLKSLAQKKMDVAAVLDPLRVKDEQFGNSRIQNRHAQEQEVVVQILGVRDRRPSMGGQRHDVYDYLHTRNLVPDEASPTKGTYLLPDVDKHHVYLRRIVFNKLPISVKKSSVDNIWFKVNNKHMMLEWSSKKEVTPVYDKETGTVTFELPGKGLHLFEDIQIIMYSSGLMGGKQKLLQFWLNTRFVVADGCHVLLTKPEIDKANKDTKDKAFASDFSIALDFDSLKEYQDNMYSVLDEIEEKCKEYEKVLTEGE